MVFTVKISLGEGVYISNLNLEKFKTGGILKLGQNNIYIPLNKISFFTNITVSSDG